MVNVNDIVEGKVTGITAFGAFVQIQDGTTGLIHISEISTGYVSDINDYLKVGQTVKAVALSVEKDGKLSLSLKRYLELEQGEIPKSIKREYKKQERKQNKGNFQSKGNLLYSQSPVYESSKDSSSFEDKLNKFMKDSDEKLSALRKSTESKRGGGYVRRG